jgi:hypothetical protein
MPMFGGMLTLVVHVWRGFDCRVLERPGKTL